MYKKKPGFRPDHSHALSLLRIQLLVLLISSSMEIVAQAQLATSSGIKHNRVTGSEWTTLRGNNNRDGRVVSTGQFKTTARLRESLDFSVSEGYIELSPAKKTSKIVYRNDDISNEELLLPLSTAWQTETTTKYETETGAYLDLYDDGKLTMVHVTQNTKYAQLFEGDKKWYRIEAIDGFGVTKNENNDVFVGIRVYKGDTDAMVFEKKFRKGQHMQRPHITVADMNNDTKQDIIITSWEGIYVFDNKGDSIAGLSQDAKGWHHLRKRGFASIADIDGNGYKDVVIIGTLPWHVDVINNDKGVLKFGWTRIFDGLVETAKKISKPILKSVSDFDGDGTYEILVNVYNYNDDNNWTAVLFNAVNGDVKAQLKGEYVVSAEDLNNDGRYVFFSSHTQGQAVPLTTTLKVSALSNGTFNELFRIPKGTWINPRIVNTSPAITTHADGITNIAEDQVLCADYQNTGSRAFFARSNAYDGKSVLNGYYLSKDGKVKNADLSIVIPAGMYGEILRDRINKDGSHSLLLQVRASGAPAGVVAVSGADAKDVGRFITSSSKVKTPVVADIDADGQTEIIVATDLGEVLCFGRSRDGVMHLRWKVPGRGMVWQYAPAVDHGVTVDDLDHDGYKEVIVSGWNDVGAVLFLYDHKGKMLWHADFPEINAGEISAWNGNIAFFGTVQSSKRKGRDVIVTVQRGIAHGGKTYCLNGTDGSVVWQLDRLMAPNGEGRTIDSGAGGYVFTTHDIDGDGSDEVMCGYGNIVFFADSNDGTIKFKSFMRKVFTDKYNYPAHGYQTFWMQQIVPVAFSASGVTELACFNTAVAAGTMYTTGELSWCPPELQYNERYWQCMSDLEGNGKLWVVELSVRSADNMPVLFAYDPVNGQPHKSFVMEMPGYHPGLSTAVMPVSCDMNGDGRDEIVVSNKQGVSCIGLDGNRPSVLWSYKSANCGPAVIADVDSDGFVEVVTATQEGKILVLDN